MQVSPEMDLTAPHATHPPGAGPGKPNKMPAVEGHLVSSERRKKIYIKCLLCAMTLSAMSFFPADPLPAAQCGLLIHIQTAREVNPAPDQTASSQVGHSGLKPRPI